MLADSLHTLSSHNNNIIHNHHHHHHHFRFTSATHMPVHIHALPVELLTRIFLLGWQEDQDPDNALTSHVSFEALVSHVCHHWRDLALRTPSLWSIVHFRTTFHMHRAHIYLSRSTRHLIDIYVDTCAEDEHQPGYTLFRDEFFPVFDIVVPHIHRWRSLLLKVRDLDCKARARKVLSSCGGAQHLETLHLWHVENWGTPERLYTAIGPPPVVVFDRQLPSLKHIILTGVNLPWIHSPFLRDLTTVQFSLHSDEVRMPYDLWRTMLLASPNLYRLSLHYSGPRFGTGDWPDEKIPLPGLRELELTNMDPPYLLALFRHLTMPGVRKLKLELELPDQDFSPVVNYLVDPTTEEEQAEAEGDGEQGGEEEGGQTGEQQQHEGEGQQGGGANGFTPATTTANGDTSATASSSSSASPSSSSSSASPPPPTSASTRRRGPFFPNIDSLILSALDCSRESFRRFLQTAREASYFEADFGRMTQGMLEEMLSVGEEEVEVEVEVEVEEQIAGGGDGGVGESESGCGGKGGKGKGKERAVAMVTTEGERGKGKKKKKKEKRKRTCILLPKIHTIRLSGLKPAQVRRFIDFRHEHFRPPTTSCPPMEEEDRRVFPHSHPYPYLSSSSYPSSSSSSVTLTSSTSSPPPPPSSSSSTLATLSPSLPPSPIASPLRWLLEQRQCDEEIDGWFADVGLYVSEEEKEREGREGRRWEMRERVEWFKGEYDDEEEEEEGEGEEGEEEGEEDDDEGMEEEEEAEDYENEEGDEEEEEDL